MAWKKPSSWKFSLLGSLFSFVAATLVLFVHMLIHKLGCVFFGSSHVFLLYLEVHPALHVSFPAGISLKKEQRGPPFTKNMRPTMSIGLNQHAFIPWASKTFWINSWGQVSSSARDLQKPMVFAEKIQLCMPCWSPSAASNEGPDGGRRLGLRDCSPEGWLEHQKRDKAQAVVVVVRVSKTSCWPYLGAFNILTWVEASSTASITMRWFKDKV